MSKHYHYDHAPLRGTTVAPSTIFHTPHHPPLPQHPPAPAQNQTNMDLNHGHCYYGKSQNVPQSDGFRYRSHEQAQYSDPAYSAASSHNPQDQYPSHRLHQVLPQSVSQPHLLGPSQEANIAWPETHPYYISSTSVPAPYSEPFNNWVPFSDLSERGTKQHQSQLQVIPVKNQKLASARSEKVKTDIASLIELISSKRYYYRLLCRDLTGLIDKVEDQKELERLACVFAELLDLAKRNILMEQRQDARAYKRDCREDFLSALQKLKNYLEGYLDLEVTVLGQTITADETDGYEDDQVIHLLANAIRSVEDEAYGLVHERHYSCWLDPENHGILKLRKMKTDDKNKDLFSWDGDHIIIVPVIKDSFDIEFRLLSKFKEILAKGWVNTLPVPSSSKLSEYQRSIHHEFKLNIIMKPFMRPHSTFVSCVCRFYDYVAFNDDGVWKEVQNKLLLTLPVLPEKIPICKSGLPEKDPPLYLAKDVDIILTAKEKAASCDRNGQMHKLRNNKNKSGIELLELRELEKAERIAIGRFNYRREMKQLQGYSGSIK